MSSVGILVLRVESLPVVFPFFVSARVIAVCFEYDVTLETSWMLADDHIPPLGYRNRPIAGAGCPCRYAGAPCVHGDLPFLCFRSL